VKRIYTHIARIFIVVMIMTTVMSTLAMANGSGWRGRGRDKKFGRFINRHDGRDGRFDGRGPRRDRRYDRWYGGDRGRWDRGRSRWMDWNDRNRFNRRHHFRDRRFDRRFW
jgi:hypothetical protein